jgi:hypothetical protein
VGNGAAGATRTPDLVLRRHALYPTELQPHAFLYIMRHCMRAFRGVVLDGVAAEVQNPREWITSPRSNYLVLSF